MEQLGSELRSSTGPRRRRSQDIVDGMAVRAAVAQIVKKVAELQHEAAFVRGLTEHALARPDLLQHIVTLGVEAASVAGEFEVLVGSLPPRQRENSRIIDLDRSLQSLIAGIPRIESYPRD